MVRKRKRPELDTANQEEYQQPEISALNGTHSLDPAPLEHLLPPEAQLKSASEDLVSLHRARFVPWQPTAVVASATSNDGSLLAVAHESGAIEVWETTSWTCRQVLTWCHPSQRLCAGALQHWKLLFCRSRACNSAACKRDLDEPPGLLVHF